MAIVQKKPMNPPPLRTAAVVTGAHTHQCSRQYHQWDCQFSTSCRLETIAGAQKLIDEMCPACHALAYGAYAS